MTHTTNEREIPTDLLMQLRKLLPKRRLTYAESRTVAKLQALRLRKLLDITSPSADLRWTLRLPNVVVKGLPAHEIREIAKGDASGITKRLKNGDYFIGVNQNRTHAHRRFTMAHEIKHWLDYPYASTVYAGLGYGNKLIHDKRVESLCDYFAAHFLMPDALLKKAWTNGFQDVPALAGMFSVSEEAMQIRLKDEGFVGLEDLHDELLFRRVGLLPELGLTWGNAA